jgi:hypothetical protein
MLDVLREQLTEHQPYVKVRILGDPSRIRIAKGSFFLPQRQEVSIEHPTSVET